MHSTIHSIQSSCSDLYFLKHPPVEELEIRERSKNASENLNNFMSSCPISVIFGLRRSARCVLQFISYNRLDSTSPSYSVPQLKSSQSAKQAKMPLKTSITS